VQVAERSLKFFAVRLARGRKKRLDEIDEVGMREWLFEKVDRAETGSPRAVRGKVNARQDDGARIRMAGAQIVEKILAQIGNGIHVENEKVRPIVHDEALGLFEITGKIGVGGRRGFPQRGENLCSKILLGFEHQNAPALFERILRMRRGCFVHNSRVGQGCRHFKS